MEETINNLTTPACLLDLNVLKKNAKEMREKCNKLGLNLRPHCKNHKTLELGNILTNGSKRCITVSTVTEAEYFASGGFDDILYAFPINENKIKRCQILSENLEAFHVLLDSEYGLNCLEENPLQNGKDWSVFLSVDCGSEREGVEWNEESSFKLAENVANARGVNLKGLYSFCGDGYRKKIVEEVVRVSENSCERIASFKNEIDKRGINVDICGIGSTPVSKHLGEKTHLINELHPGSYVYNDIELAIFNCCKREEIAMRIMTTVIGHYPKKGHMLIDCGKTAFAATETNLKTGISEFQGHPNLRLDKFATEHGYVTAVNGELDYEKYPIGSKLFLYPYKACYTANCYQKFHIHENEKVVGIWKPCKGW